MLCLVVMLSITLATAPFALAAPAPSAVNQPLIAGCTEQVQNGSFEVLNSVWSILPSATPATYSNALAFEGSNSMQLGIITLPNQPSVSQVEQTVTLPANASTLVLSFRYYPQFDSAPGAGDLQYVDLYNNANNAFIARPLQVQSNARTWLLGQYDLSALRGQTIRLVFGVNNDGFNGRMAMNVDVASVIACTPTPSPTGTIPSPTFTPSITPITPTSTPVPGVPPGCVNIILNGAFEDNSAWIFGDTPAPPQYVGNPVYAGMRSLQSGNPPNYRPPAMSFSSAQQLVTLPASASTAELRWWMFPRSEEPVSDSITIGADRQEVILLNPNQSTKEVIFRVRRNAGGYVQEVRDLTPYLGQTFWVYFNVFNDGSNLRTWMFLDDVQLFVCYPGGGTPTNAFVPWTPSPTPVPPPTATPTPIGTPLITALQPLGTMVIPEILTAVGTLDGTLASEALRNVAEAAMTPTPTSGEDGALQGATVILVLIGIVVVIGLIVWAIIRVVTRNG